MALIGVWGCRDEINLPEYVDTSDKIDPGFVISSPIADSTYRGLDTLPISIMVFDDIKLGYVDFRLTSDHPTDTGFRYELSLSSDTAWIDTYYLIPSTDSLTYNAMLFVHDDYGNIVIESYTFATKS